jgi:hypothetical protein
MPRRAKDPEKKKNPWTGRLKKMQEYQDENLKNHKRNLVLLFGRDESNEKSLGQCAYAWGLFRSLISTCYIQNPECMIEAYDDKQKSEAARLMTNVVRYDFDVMRLKQTGNMAVLDCFTDGYGAVIEKVRNDKDFREDEQFLKSQQYLGDRVPPKDFFVDPAGTRLDLSDHKYIAIRFYPTISDVKNDEVFGDDLPKEIDNFPEASTFQKNDSSTPAKTEREKDPDFRTICMWEVHDKVNKKIVYFCDADKDHTWEVDWPVELNIGGLDFFPVTLMYFFPSPTGFYPIPLIDVIAKQLEVINKIDSRIYADATTKWRKFVTYDSVLDATQKAKITDDSPDNCVITLKSEDLVAETASGKTLPQSEDVIWALQEPQIKQEAAAARQLVVQEITDIVGFGSPARGGMAQTRSAREAVAMKERQDQRLNEYTDAITEFTRLFGQKHVLFLQQTMNEDRYVRVLPEEAQGLSMWKQYTRDDIQGQFHFEVFAGTSMPRTSESRRQMELNFFNTVAPVLQAAGYPLEPLIIRMGEVFQFRNVEQFFQNYKAEAKKFAVILAQAQKNPAALKAHPEQILEQGAKLVQAALSPGELTALAQQMKGGQAGSQPSGEPSGQRGDPNAGATGAGAM